MLVLQLPIAAASVARAQAPAPPPQILDCADFSKATDEVALVRRFGRENVAAAKLDGAEGATVRGTAVFPKDPTRRLEITWQDEAKRRGLASIAVRGRSDWTVRTPARAPIGLRTSLTELEEANGRPFLINGFGWDYGGFGAGWKGGALDKMPGGCFLGVRFSPDPKAGDKALSAVSGDKQVRSSDPTLRAVKPALSSITLDWPE